MLSAAGGRTPEVWNLPYANPHHGSLVNGTGRESLAEEEELLRRQGCTEPTMQRRLCRHGARLCRWPLWTATDGGSTSLPAEAVTL